jgi:hypothetical protein
MIRLDDGLLGLKWRATADEETIISPYPYDAGAYQKTAIVGEFMTAKSLGIAIGRAAQDRLSASHHHGDAYIPGQTA